MSTHSSNVENWSQTELDSWFAKEEWKQGWNAAPDASTDKKEFAVQYFKNKERWDNAFKYLAETDLANIEAGKYKLEGDALVSNVTDYVTRNEEDTKYEAHIKYADIQYVAKGKELMGVLPLDKMGDVKIPYNDEKDVVFYNCDEDNNILANQDNFFVLFPNDGHKPCLKVDENEDVRKIVIKVLLD